MSYETLLVAIEIIGATVYLANKFCFLLKEYHETYGSAEKARVYHKASWYTVAMGLPFVTAVLISEKDWIFGLFELAVLPAIVVALMRARSGGLTEPSWTMTLIYISSVCGALISRYDLGTITSLHQLLEIASVSTFLIGTHLLAREQRIGYMFYILMHLAAGSLLFLQHHFWFAAQQVASIVAVTGALFFAIQRK